MGLAHWYVETYSKKKQQFNPVLRNTVGVYAKELDVIYIKGLNH